MFYLFFFFKIPAQTLTVLTIDAAPNPCEIDTNLLGTDYMFLTAFLGTYTFIFLVHNYLYIILL